ncbi:MAG: DegV family protein [Oscillospiraceae bacterium]|jgi:DegV family protein with EDD domain|nr:DegV family protein [Oscillospiraceae bacterium]
MSKSFAIVVDTSCDISQEYLEANDIKVMPITFMLDDVEHSMGYWQEIDADDFYEALGNGAIAKTAQINPDAFVASYTEYASKDEDVLYLVLSSGLSATYQSSQIALTEIKETYPNCNIYPIDGIGATVLNAAILEMIVDKRTEGLSAAETAEYIEKIKHHVLGFVTVDDLMYLHRGGRLSKLSALGGSIIGIKPIICIEPDGTLALKSKVRGREAALRQIATQLKQTLAPNSTVDTIYISHSNCEEDALKLADIIKADVNVNRVVIQMLGPVIGAHVGPGAVVLVFTSDLTREQYNNTFFVK